MNRNEVITGALMIGSMITIGFIAHQLCKKKTPKDTLDNTLSRSIKENLKSSSDKEESEVLKGDEFPLRLGSKGDRVYLLNVYLLREYGKKGKATQLFDENTEKTVMRYLKMKEIDKVTYDSLGIAKPKYSKF